METRKVDRQVDQFRLQVEKGMDVHAYKTLTQTV